MQITHTTYLQELETIFRLLWCFLLLLSTRYSRHARNIFFEILKSVIQIQRSVLQCARCSAESGKGRAHKNLSFCQTKDRSSSYVNSSKTGRDIRQHWPCSTLKNCCRFAAVTKGIWDRDGVLFWGRNISSSSSCDTTLCSFEEGHLPPAQAIRLLPLAHNHTAEASPRKIIERGVSWQHAGYIIPPAVVQRPKWRLTNSVWDFFHAKLHTATKHYKLFNKSEAPRGTPAPNWRTQGWAYKQWLLHEKVTIPDRRNSRHRRTHSISYQKWYKTWLWSCEHCKRFSSCNTAS